jgi:TonB family protein
MKFSVYSLLVALMCISVLSIAVGQKEPPPDQKFDKAPEVTKQVQPHYPDLATRGGVEGTVYVKIWVDKNGKVAQTEVVKSDARVLDLAAREAAQQWEFKPALLKGKAIDVWVTVPFKFKLSDGDKKKAVSMSLKARRFPPAEDVKHDTEPELVDRIDPMYPEEAKQAGLEGTVYTKMWIDDNGKVVEAIVTKSDNPVFNQASMEAALQWTFKPATANGKPIAVWVTVPFRFKIG